MTKMSVKAKLIETHALHINTNFKLLTSSNIAKTIFLSNWEYQLDNPVCDAHNLSAMLTV